MYHLFLLILMVVTGGGLGSAISQRPLLVVLYIDHNQAFIYFKPQTSNIFLDRSISLVFIVIVHAFCSRFHCSRPRSTKLACMTVPRTCRRYPLTRTMPPHFPIFFNCAQHFPLFLIPMLSKETMLDLRYVPYLVANDEFPTPPRHLPADTRETTPPHASRPAQTTSRHRHSCNSCTATGAVR